MATVSTSPAVQYNPRLGFWISLIGATIGLLYGYDLGAISGALPYLTKQFDLTTIMQEIVTSGVTAGAVIGAFTAGKISNAIGRKKMMVIICSGFALFAILEGIAPNAMFLMVIRLFLGITIGFATVVAPIFVAELAPKKIRGRLVVMYQIATTSGIAVAYFVDLGFSYSADWRMMLSLSAIPAIILLFPVLTFSDTPRWYIMKGKKENALKILRRLEPAENINSELEEIQRDLVNTERGSFSELFHGKLIKATIFAAGLGLFGQIVGINAIIFYSPEIFKLVGFTSTSGAILATLITQLAAIGAECVSLAIVDRLGRRPILLIGIGCMVVPDFIMAVLLYYNHFPFLLSALAFLAILIYHMGFSFGFGCLVWVYASETFPARLRAVGGSLTLGMNFIGNLAISLLFLTMVNSLGGMLTFGVFFVITVLSWVFIFALAPETKGRPLEAIRTYWDNGGHWPNEVQ